MKQQLAVRCKLGKLRVFLHHRSDIFSSGAQFAFLTAAEQFPELLPEPHQLHAELQVLGDGYAECQGRSLSALTRPLHSPAAHYCEICGVKFDSRVISFRLQTLLPLFAVSFMDAISLWMSFMDGELPARGRTPVETFRRETSHLVLISPHLITFTVRKGFTILVTDLASVL